MTRGLSQGIRLALFSATLFGLSTPLAKALVAALQPEMLASLLYLGSGIGLFWLARRRQGEPGREGLIEAAVTPPGGGRPRLERRPMPPPDARRVLPGPAPAGEFEPTAPVQPRCHCLGAPGQLADLRQPGDPIPA
jgi:hypothetical protein